ncbi:hypothetical protein ACIF84_30915 [Streptomyces albidoflavus]
MLRRFRRRRGNAPGPITPEDQAVIDQFHAYLAGRAALRNPTPWNPGQAEDIAVRVGPYVERAHIRPGDRADEYHVVVALEHPHGSRAPYLDRYLPTGWLRCPTTQVIGTWTPDYTPFTHATAGLSLPEDLGMESAQYAIHVETRSHSGDTDTLVSFGPYDDARHLEKDITLLDAAIEGRRVTLVPGHVASVYPAPYYADEKHIDPTSETDPVNALLDVAERVTSH